MILLIFIVVFVKFCVVKTVNGFFFLHTITHLFIIYTSFRDDLSVIQEKSVAIRRAGNIPPASQRLPRRSRRCRHHISLLLATMPLTAIGAT
jgi:hypothetical protein